MNNTPSYLVFAADLGFFHKVARDYKRDALVIKNNDYSSCTPTFHLLSSLAFELFPKVLLGHKTCLKYKNDSNINEEAIRKEISDEIRKYNHSLDKLYLSFPDMINYLDIKNISSFNNGFVWEYRIELNKDNKNISIKDIEPIRFGSFAKNRDILTSCIGDDILVDLLNKIEKYVMKKDMEINEQLKK